MRFLIGSVAAWVVMRGGAALLLAPSSATFPAGDPAPAPVAGVDRPAPASPIPPAPVPAGGRLILAAFRPPVAASTPRYRAGGRSVIVAGPGAPADATAHSPPLAAEERVAAAGSVAVQPTGGDVTARRWSGSAWIYGRQDGGSAIAPGGQLGGGQAGVRIVRRLDDHVALAGRVSMPTGDSGGAEAAAGLDWMPFGKATALRLSVERRVALGPRARNAWSAYAAGGFYREIGGAIVVDGYAQAGVVGTRRRDLFADGAIRGGRRIPLGPTHALTLGGGIWGAAQPRVERLDIGPRMAIGIPLARVAATLALEGRLRVAGQARPGSGAALTLAADF